MIISENVNLLGNGFFNYYIIGKKEAAIIECGSSVSAEILAKQWSQLKKKPEIKYLVIMHAHFDHVCGIPVLKRLFPNAKIVASSIAQGILNKEKVVKNMFVSDAAVTERYVQHKLIDEPPLFEPWSTIPVDVVVSEGSILDIDKGLQLKFLDAPGHSKCSIAAYLETDQAMFVSDAAGYRFDDEEISPVFFQDYTSYMDTLNKLRSYPTKIVGLAHGDVVLQEEVAKFYEQSIDSSKQVFNYIKMRLKEGAAEDALAQELFNKYIKSGLSYYPADTMLATRYLLINNVKALM